MQIKPLSDHVVVKIIDEPKVTASGIVLPETAEKEKKAEGLVVAVGPGRILESGARSSMDVKEGDKVLFKKWSGDEIEVGGVEHKVVRLDDILAVLA